jgi:hypothetical protein
MGETSSCSCSALAAPGAGPGIIGEEFAEASVGGAGAEVTEGAAPAGAGGDAEALPTVGAVENSSPLMIAIVRPRKFIPLHITILLMPPN